MDHTDLNEKSFVYLGDRRDEMTQKIQQAFDGGSRLGRSLSRMPRYIIEEHIQDDSYRTIGGDLQLGIADQFGFRPFSICKPRVPREPEAYFSYLGYDLHQDIRNVGHAFVSLNGMI
jgi:hypothetical protein